MRPGVKRTASEAVSKMETNLSAPSREGWSQGQPPGPASPGLSRAWALSHPPDDVMLAPASTAHVWTFQPVCPSPDLPPRFLTHSFPSLLFKNKSQRPNVSAGSLEECLQPGWRAMSGRRVLGCRDWENLEMGYWKQPGPTWMLTQPPRHGSSIPLCA